MKLKKEELKSVLKPVIEECVREMIAERGFLSSIISEVYASTGSRTVVQEEKQQNYKQKESEFIKQKTSQTNQALIEHKKKLMDVIGKNAYGGVNVFEGLNPIDEGKKPSSSPTHAAPSALEVLDPANTGGVNIDKIPGMGRWASVLKGAEKLKD
jgi:hypothetical protein